MANELLDNDVDCGSPLALNVKVFTPSLLLVLVRGGGGSHVQLLVSCSGVSSSIKKVCFQQRFKLRHLTVLPNGATFF